MPDDGQDRSKPQEAPDQAPSKGDAKSEGNSLQDASDEMVNFMEQGDEPAHAGRGDGG